MSAAEILCLLASRPHEARLWKLQGGPLSGVRINKSIGSRGQSFDWGKRREGAHDGDDAGWQGCAGGLPVGRSACHLAQSSEMAVLLMWERIGVAWTLCWGAPRASTRSLASVFRQARRGSARRVSDGAPQRRCALLERCEPAA